MKDCIFCFIAFLGAIYCLPVQQSILPHSRDYYAGYIKAITDNFEQLFAGDRQVRSTGEDDDSKVRESADPILNRNSLPLFLISYKTNIFRTLNDVIKIVKTGQNLSSQ